MNKHPIVVYKIYNKIKLTYPVAGCTTSDTHVGFIFCSITHTSPGPGGAHPLGKPQKNLVFFSCPTTKWGLGQGLATKKQTKKRFL